MSENLYQLSLALQNIQDELVESGGELTLDLEKRLDETNLTFNEKVESIGKWVRNIGGHKDMLDAEIVRLQARKSGAEALEKRLKDYVLTCMQQAGKTKMEYGLFSITIAKNPPNVGIVEGDLIPARFITIKTETVINKTEIIDALKAGEKIPGARLINDRVNLRIK